MSKAPKFLASTNPMVDEHSFYITHTQKPRFLAKHTPGNPLSEFEIIDDIDNMSAFFNNDPIKLAGLMRRLGDWFVAYCNWCKQQDN